jgi:hypothetical protein
LAAASVAGRELDRGSPANSARTWPRPNGQEFRALLESELRPGTTLVVTNDSMRASSAGEKLTVIDADQ